MNTVKHTPHLIRVKEERTKNNETIEKLKTTVYYKGHKILRPSIDEIIL